VLQLSGDSAVDLKGAADLGVLADASLGVSKSSSKVNKKVGDELIKD
jgi:hypothetical protein